MKQRVKFFSRDAGLQIGEVEPPAESISEKLTEHSRRFLFPRFGFYN